MQVKLVLVADVIANNLNSVSKKVEVSTMITVAMGTYNIMNILRTQ